MANLGHNAMQDQMAQLQAEAAADDAAFDANAGRVTVAEHADIQPGAVDNTAGRDAQAEQDEEDAEDLEERREQNAADMEVYKTMTPEEVFTKFDTDGSGYIDFDEYKAMLPQLGIKMTEAKARKYYNLADTDGSGEVDFEEFRVAMYAVDPNSGNTSGFAPNSLLTPLDAFEMFDEDGSGHIDEDEFFFVLQYLGLKVSDQKQDVLFQKYDEDGSGTMDYEEFKQCWLKTCKVFEELVNRDIKPPQFATRAELERMLEKEVNKEEDAEALAIAEAKQFKAWQAVLKDKKEHYFKAKRRVMVELRNALDTAGQVYCFGEGTFGQFTADVARSMSTKNGPFMGFDEVYDMWKGRLFPEESFLYKVGLEERVKEWDPDAEEDKLEIGKNLSVDDPRAEILKSPFKECHCITNTATLWARRVVQVKITDSVAMALTELGDLYTWGGMDHWWHEVEVDAAWQNQWRGETTPRSTMLLTTNDKTEPEEIIDGIPEDEDEVLADKLKAVLIYYGRWQPPPLPSERLTYYKDVLFVKIPYPELLLTAEVRGVRVENKTKMELLHILFDCICLEKDVLGERTHKQIREFETDILDLRKKKRKNLAKKIVTECQEMWEPLLQMQAEKRAEDEMQAKKEKEAAEIAIEQNYQKYRVNIQNSRLDATAQYSARGNSLQIALGGITERGGALQTPRAHAHVVHLDCGAHHTALVHQNGQLYTWGFGASGRLGHDMGQGGDPRGDAQKPVVVQALMGRPVVRVACGYNHTAALTIDGKMYVWGSGSTGKLGLGSITGEEECYSSVPTPVIIGKSLRVRSIGCGSAHTGAITDRGELFMWGCGNGGRLGLGPGLLGTQYTPKHIQGFEGQKVASVSCGNSHTLVTTVIKEVYRGEGTARVKVKVGGDCYQAGPQNVCGKFCPSFVLVPGLADLSIACISAGFNHSAVTTTSGEIFCWGNNYTGCCGALPHVRFCYEPHNIRCVYERPVNIALGRNAQMSSVYNGRGAYLAVDGNLDGDMEEFCCSTQSESQPWFEIDLGEFAIIQTVKLWNRNDEPVDPAFDRDMFRERLFPCYLILSQVPLPQNRKVGSHQEAGSAVASGRTNLQACLDISKSRMKLTKIQRCSTWHVPNNTMARYIRVQLEGFTYMHFSQLEVFGTMGINKPVGRASSVCAGKNVTIACVRPLSDPKDVDRAYRRAVKVDAHNAHILRQFETFALEYDKYGTGENIKRCLVCKGGELCEVCTMNLKFKTELDVMPLGIGGRRPTFDQCYDYLVNCPKPPLDYVKPVRHERSGFSDFKESMFGIKHELTHVEEPKKHAHEETKEGEAGENGQEAHGNAASGQGGKVAPEGVPFIRPDGSILNRGFEYLPIPETTNPTIWTKTKADWRPSFVGKSFYCCCQLCCVAELLEGDGCGSACPVKCCFTLCRITECYECAYGCAGHYFTWCRLRCLHRSPPWLFYICPCLCCAGDVFGKPRDTKIVGYGSEEPKCMCFHCTWVRCCCIEPTCCGTLEVLDMNGKFVPITQAGGSAPESQQMDRGVDAKSSKNRKKSSSVGRKVSADITKL